MRWAFTPDSAPTGQTDHKVLGVTADTNFLRFGFWLQTTPGEDGDPTTYKFQAFSDGSSDDDTGPMEIAAVCRS